MDFSVDVVGGEMPQNLSGCLSGCRRAHAALPPGSRQIALIAR